MFCPKCGRELQDGAKFCGGCGASVGEPSQAQAPSAQSASVSQTPAPQPAQAQTPPQAAKPSVDVKAKISNMQGKLDNSNSKFLKGRSIWDVIGLCAVVLIVISYFLPIQSISGVFGGSESYSFAQIAGEASKDVSPMLFFVIYLMPAILCTIDFIITKENASRHLRLVLVGLFGLFFELSFLAIVEEFVSKALAKASFCIGFYFFLIGYLVIVAVGIIGIIEKKKGKIVC